jgi:ferredoxin-type protein NapF
MAKTQPLTRRAFLTGRQTKPARQPGEVTPAMIQISEACLPRAGISCMACRDACEPAAIRFRPRVGGPFLPEIDAEACTGCGECISVCPADAIEFAVTCREAADA